MNNIEVILPKIVNKISLLLKILGGSGVALLCISFFRPFGMGGMATIITLFIGILLLNSRYIIKDYRITGTVILLPDKIIVNDSERSCTYPISDLSDIKVTLLGIKGEFYRGKAITTKIGTDNFIKFRYQGVQEEVEFLLEEQNSFPLAKVLQAWRRNNIVFKLHNQTREKFI
jgi:hypothetical protein